MNDFDRVLAKNRIVRELKNQYKNAGYSLNEIPEYIKQDFDEIEKDIGVMNQPTGRDILESELDI